MIGLQGHRPDLTGYRECIDTIEAHVKQFSAAELEEMNARERQAGTTALKWEDFKETSHVRPHTLCLPPLQSVSLRCPTLLGTSPPSPPTMDHHPPRAD